MAKKQQTLTLRQQLAELDNNSKADQIAETEIARLQSTLGSKNHSPRMKDKLNHRIGQISGDKAAFISQRKQQIADTIAILEDYIG